MPAKIHPPGASAQVLSPIKLQAVKGGVVTSISRGPRYGETQTWGWEVTSFIDYTNDNNFPILERPKEQSWRFETLETMIHEAGLMAKYHRKAIKVFKRLQSKLTEGERSLGSYYDDHVEAAKKEVGFPKERER